MTWNYTRSSKYYYGAWNWFYCTPIIPLLINSDIRKANIISTYSTLLTLSDINGFLHCWYNVLLLTLLCMFTCFLKLTKDTPSFSADMRVFLGFNIILVFLTISEAITVYRSLEPIDTILPMAGLRLNPKSILKETNFTKGVSFCGRFNYRKLGWYSKMIDAMSYPFFVTMYMGEPNTFINFGNLWLIVKDIEKNTFHIWSTNKWHHICLSFDRSKFHLKLYKVS